MENRRLLAEVLEGLELPDRTQLILELAPGCMFGFPPDNLGHIMEMVDCTTCRKIMGVVKRCSAIATDLTRQINDFCRAVRDRNQARNDEYERIRRWFIVGRFVRPPRLEPEPEYKNEVWFAVGECKLKELADRLPQLAEQCPRHWGTEEDRNISRGVVGRFWAKDSAYVLTL